MINFRTRISHGVSHSLALFNLFLYSDASAGPAMVSPPIGKFWSCSLSFYWLYNKLKTRCPFHCITYGYSRADWVGLHAHLRDVSWEDIFKLSAFSAVNEFYDWVQVGIGVYIPHVKYQVKLLIRDFIVWHI